MAKLVAHRGYPLHYPENTLAGIEAAIRAGAACIEVDVQLSRDGVAVLFHDRDLQRICGREGAIHDYAWTELQAFSAADSGRFADQFENVPLASLADFARLLADYPQVLAFIELKRISIEHFGVENIVACVLKTLQPVLAQCVIISYSLAALARVRETSTQPIGVVVDEWREQAQARTLSPEYLFCNMNSLPNDASLALSETQLVVFECADPEQARALFARGVDFVETFAIGEMLAKLQASGAE